MGSAFVHPGSKCNCKDSAYGFEGTCEGLPAGDCDDRGEYYGEFPAANPPPEHIEERTRRSRIGACQCACEDDEADDATDHEREGRTGLVARDPRCWTRALATPEPACSDMDDFHERLVAAHQPYVASVAACGPGLVYDSSVRQLAFMSPSQMSPQPMQHISIRGAPATAAAAPPNQSCIARVPGVLLGSKVAPSGGVQSSSNTGGISVSPVRILTPRGHASPTTAAPPSPALLSPRGGAPSSPAPTAAATSVAIPAAVATTVSGRTGSAGGGYPDGLPNRMASSTGGTMSTWRAVPPPPSPSPVPTTQGRTDEAPSMTPHQRCDDGPGTGRGPPNLGGHSAACMTSAAPEDQQPPLKFMNLPMVMLDLGE